jgi:hypothetical protein
VDADASLSCEGNHEQHDQHAPLTTLMALEHTIQQRRLDMQQQSGGQAPAGPLGWSLGLTRPHHCACRSTAVGSAVGAHSFGSQAQCCRCRDLSGCDTRERKLAGHTKPRAAFSAASLFFGGGGCYM